MTREEAELELMESLGFKYFGPIFKDTLAYVQIQRKKDEIRKKHTKSTTK